LNHDPVYISEISKERERWSAASTFTIKAAASTIHIILSI
jgi:hypothetical protein